MDFLIDMQELNIYWHFYTLLSHFSMGGNQIKIDFFFLINQLKVIQDKKEGIWIKLPQYYHLILPHSLPLPPRCLLLIQFQQVFSQLIWSISRLNFEEVIFSKTYNLSWSTLFIPYLLHHIVIWKEHCFQFNQIIERNWLRKFQVQIQSYLYRNREDKGYPHWRLVSLIIFGNNQSNHKQ